MMLTAYLNGDLSHEVYMKQPEGYQEGGHKIVCKLQKNLYGLKQEANEWHRRKLVKNIGGLIAFHRNRRHLISRAPTKAKSQEPAYSQALNQNKIDRQRSISRESGRQTVRRL